MPDRSWSGFLWVKEIRKLRGERQWLAPAPVYAAAAMILVAALLMLAVVGGVKYSARPAPDPRTVRSAPAGALVAAGREETPTAAASTATSQSRPVIQDTISAKPARQAVRADTIPQRPVAGGVALGFGWQEQPIFHDWRYHTGIDLEARESEPVRAMFNGEVSSVSEDRLLGLTVVVSSGAYTVQYASLGATALTKGEQIEAGSRIGTVGSSPGEPFSHLHLAVKYGDKYINPAELLNKAE